MKEPFKKKVENFFYHYTIHTVVGVLLTIFVISFGYSIIKGQIENYKDRHKIGIDLEILFFGNYSYEVDFTSLEDKFAVVFPDTDIKLTYEYAPFDSMSPEDAGFHQRNVITLATSTPDIYIFDHYQFNKQIKDGVFPRFDESFIEDVDDDLLMYFKQEDDDDRYVYGIDLTDSELFADTAFEDIEKVVMLREDAHHLERAYEFIEEALKE